MGNYIGKIHNFQGLGRKTHSPKLIKMKFGMEEENLGPSNFTLIGRRIAPVEKSAAE